MRKPLLILSMTLFIAVGISFVRVGLSAAMSTSGIDLNVLQVQKNALEKENMVLKEVVLSKSSLSYIDSKAPSLGFVEDSSKNTRVALNAPASVALRP